MQEDYARARRLGLREYHRATSAGRYPYLTALDDILPEGTLPAEIPVGLMEIPLSMVVGTKTAGRQQAFADDFMPLLEVYSEFALKWWKLYDSQMEEGIRDPIKVYEYMHRFYVQEGNKRVSVSKFVGAYGIMGDVLRILPNKEGEEDEADKVYAEFLRFFDSAPIYEIDFTVLGSYEKLANILGLELGKPWPREIVEKLKGGFQLFETVYAQKAKDKVSISPSDAFLTYLGFYSLDSLRGISRSLLSNRIDKLWTETLLRTSDKPISLVKTPEDALVDSGSGANLVQALFGKSYTRAHPLKAAFCYERPAETSSWIYGHELGRSFVEHRFDGLVETYCFDKCGTNAELASAIDEAVSKGCDVVFTISPKQIEETMRSALHFPKVHFLNCSINLAHAGVRTYYSRMFEAKALMGTLAASLADNHKIGYVADYPIYGSVAEINAYAIGAAMVDPNVKVYLSWSSVKDSDFKSYMRENGVNIVSGQDFIKPDSPSREYGLFRLNEDGSVSNLAAPMYNWGRFYELILQSILDGRWEDEPEDQAMNYWWGMSAGVVDVIVSDRLSYYSRKMCESLKDAIMKGTMNPFSGELRSQKGVIRKPTDPHHFRSDEIITMNWLNDNVIGELPKMADLTEAGQQTVMVSGILRPDDTE